MALATLTEPARACFFSDLHLFARRSRADEYLSRLKAAVARSKYVVLGGDIFDFRWSEIACERETADAAERWLRELLAAGPETQVHYICGNHDCARIWTDRLDAIASGDGRFHWHEYWLQARSTLFLHGDAADRRAGHADLVQRRQRWSTVRRAIWPRHLAYSAAVGLRLHTVPSRLWHSPDQTVSRIDHYLQSLELPAGRAVEQVVFGHTHRPLDGHQHNGVRYFNGGAPLHGTRFRILEVEI